MKKAFPIVVILAFLLGLISQFMWKMIYFPEPLGVVILEIIGFTILAIVAIWCIGSS